MKISMKNKIIFSCSVIGLCWGPVIFAQSQGVGINVIVHTDMAQGSIYCKSDPQVQNNCDGANNVYGQFPLTLPDNQSSGSLTFSDSRTNNAGTTIFTYTTVSGKITKEYCTNQFRNPMTCKWDEASNTLTIEDFQN